MATSPDPDPEALLAAYIDGVSELSPAERRAVEAGLPERRADADATRDLLAALRELPGEGAEPVWTDLARRISEQVGDRVPRPWWRRWYLPAAAGALALAACALVWLHPGEVPPAPAPSVATVPAPAPAPAAAAEPEPALWLDGQAIELGALEHLAPEDRAALGALGAEPADPDDDVIGGALLPTPDLAWIDELDPDSLAVAERWLVAQKGS